MAIWGLAMLDVRLGLLAMALGRLYLFLGWRISSPVILLVGRIALWSRLAFGSRGRWSTRGCAAEAIVSYLGRMCTVYNILATM